MASKRLFKKRKEKRTKPVQLASSHLKSSQQESSHSDSKPNVSGTLPGESCKVQNLTSISQDRRSTNLSRRKSSKSATTTATTCLCLCLCLRYNLCLAQSVVGPAAQATVAYAWPKLQELGYGILPSTAGVFSYAIGSRKLSANEQLFCWCSNRSNFMTLKQLKLYHAFVL